MSDEATTSLDQANILLRWLCDSANPNWERVLQEALTSAELNPNLVNVRLGLSRAGRSAPVGAVLGGTGLAKQNAGLDGEDSQRAVRILKSANRLMQAGKGRGKALVVLNDAPVKEQELAEVPLAATPVPAEAAIPAAEVAEPETEMVSVNDVPALIRALAGHYRDLAARVDDLNREHRNCPRQIAMLEAQVAEKDNEIADLRTQMARNESLTRATRWS